MRLQNINRFIYESRTSVQKYLKLINLLLSIVAIILIVYSYGFYLNESEMKQISLTLEFIFAFFCIDFILDFIYSFDRKKFLKENWFQSLLILLILYNGTTNLIFNNPALKQISYSLGYGNYTFFYYIFIVIYMLLLILVEFIKSIRTFKNIKLHPSTIFLFSFLLLIFSGTFLLMMPRMSNNGISFLNAIFTSTSAACVTGLVVFDVSTELTLRGQIILLILIQLGGWGILSFTSFFTTFLATGVPIKQQKMLMDITDSESISGTKKILRQIILLTLFIELIGTILIYGFWGKNIQFANFHEKIFFSLFHSVSAFCNAGFSNLPEGLSYFPIQKAYLLQLVIAFLIILGGIGFNSIVDIFSPKKLRERLLSPWKNWQIGTQIAVYSSVILILVGMLMFIFLEYNNVLTGMKKGEALITAFFQSVTTRTAGFNTVNIGILNTPTLMFFMLLMFIGASPGGTGGGIKTTTFFLMILSSIKTITGKEQIGVGNRRFHTNLFNKAFSIFFFATSFIFVSVFLLTFSDPDKDIFKLLFEEISAFATVGLSTGITSSLSDIGKIIIIVSMYIGRTGTLTLAFALTTQAISTDFKYPKAHIMVG